MPQERAPPLISVVIPTFNRSSLLRASLDSLANQTLPPEDYEIVVVNDGSTDTTEEVCRAWASRVQLRYFHIENSGISAAKNLGIFAARAPLLLFFDDDDIAMRDLLKEHLRAHKAHPDENVAILGYTRWASDTHVTPVMEYVIDIGQFLFAYRQLSHGQQLDYTYFWGGRSSCKRSFLARHGVFNQAFRTIIEDIELGYRLSKFNLRVVFHRLAGSLMIRPITYEEFCRRCQRQGNALHLFSQLHPDPAVQQYCQLVDAERRWEAMRGQLPGKVHRVEHLEQILNGEDSSVDRSNSVRELHALYGWTFRAFKLKGIIEAQREQSGIASRATAY